MNGSPAPFTIDDPFYKDHSKPFTIDDPCVNDSADSIVICPDPIIIHVPVTGMLGVARGDITVNWDNDQPTDIPDKALKALVDLVAVALRLGGCHDPEETQIILEMLITGAGEQGRGWVIRSIVDAVKVGSSHKAAVCWNLPFVWALPHSIVVGTLAGLMVLMGGQDAAVALAGGLCTALLTAAAKALENRHRHGTPQLGK